MIRQRILLIWEQELVSLEVYCSLAYISLRIPWEEARIPANHTSICSVLVSFIDTAYRSMLVFSTHPDFSPPLREAKRLNYPGACDILQTTTVWRKSMELTDSLKSIFIDTAKQLKGSA